MMLAYDSTTDQFHKVLAAEPCLDGALTSRRSSRTSSRSFRRNFLLTRIISKTGRLNTLLARLPNKHVVFIRDLGNTLVNTRWRWILTTICLVNFAVFLLFGGLWMLVAYASGDFAAPQAANLCAVNVHSFTGYVLLSIETIMTIGYGYRYPTEKCTQGWLMQIAQAFVSVAIQGILISVVYVKTAKPVTKNTESIFSKHAVICLRDGQLCLIVRIVDFMGKIAIGAKISMYFVDKSESEEAILFHLQQMKVEPSGFLFFPVEIVHVLDQLSPMWKFTPYEMLFKKFEIIIVAEGSSMVTSKFSQNRTSYINCDILWGHRFCSCLEFDVKKGKYVINYKKFNQTSAFNTPLCSAEELWQIKQTLDENCQDINDNCTKN